MEDEIWSEYEDGKKILNQYGDDLVDVFDDLSDADIKKAIELINEYRDDAVELLKKGWSVDDIKAVLEKVSKLIEPSNPYNADAKPSGNPTKITDNMDEATRRSLERENEAATTLAKNGYNIEQNPTIEGTTRKPDYLIEGEVFDCYSPAENTSVRNIGSTIEEKVVTKGQANNVVLNLDDWKGEIEELIKQLNDYPIEGLNQVLVVKNDSVICIYP